MSERKFRVAPHGLAHAGGGIGPAGTYSSNEPYPVEVTVRRVAERLEYSGTLNYTMPDTERLRGALAILDLMRNAGYQHGQRFHVTVVPE